jgi:hypothetical protein
MKKIALIALAASAAIATPAAAQVTGTINITGSVAPKCFVLPGAGSSFGGTVPMGELAQSDGTLKLTGTLEATFAAAGAAVLTTQVVCTSANPQVSVTSEPLANVAAADPGYDNSIDYTADVTFSRVGPATTVVSDPSAVAAATTATLASRLTGTGTNVSVASSGWTASGILVSGNYTGKITIVIAPGV